MTLKDFNFNFKPKYVIRLIIRNKDLETKVLNFNFCDQKNELYSLLVRIFGIHMEIETLEIHSYSSVSTILVNCSNAVYEDILDFLYRKGVSLMAIYYRSILKREPINRWGRIGYREYLEIVQTEDISKFNYRKKIKFRLYVENERIFIDEEKQTYFENCLKLVKNIDKIYSFSLS